MLAEPPLLTELTRHPILSYPLSDQQAGEEKFAAFACLHSDAHNSIRGPAYNAASAEMLYVRGSSGAQFDERAKQLRASKDVVAGIAADA